MNDQTRISQSHDAQAQELMQAVGQRVRAARAQKGLSRRALSDQSGVSPRYLAQLEGGAGNISIALLQRIAAALDVSLPELVRDNADSPGGIADRFAAADPDTQAAVLALLGAPKTQDKAARVCLIGLRGAGKSSLGSRAAHALEVPFLELNREIERQSGMPVNEVIALYGQDGYRRMEAEALDQVILRQDRLVLAVAGGITSDAETYAQLKARFHTIWIKATPEEHMSRVRGQGDTRLAAGPPGAMDQLREILRTREPLYAEADYHLNTSGKPLAVSLAELTDLIKHHGMLDGAAPEPPRRTAEL